MEFGYKKETKLSFEEAVLKVRIGLEKEGFGVITEIDARATFKKKLNIDFENYLILGACHPDTAHKILEINREMGLFLPCNVIIYQEADSVFVSSVLPTAIMKMIENNDLKRASQDIEEKLKKVIDSIF